MALSYSFNVLGALAVIFITAVGLFLDRIYSSKHSFKEPPIVRSRIPYVGHLVGMFREGLNYYDSLSTKVKLPIFTLPILSTKLYIVTSPDLVSAVSRNSKSLAFSPFISEVGSRLIGVDARSRAIIDTNLDLSAGHFGYVVETHDQIVASMAPGQELNDMNTAFFNELVEHFSEMDVERPEHTINLLAWITDLFSLRSTNAIYGPNNPLKDAGVRKAWWTFVDNLNYLLPNIHPQLLAPRGHAARDKVARAFQHYFKTFDPAGTSAFARGRWEVIRKHNFDPLNAGRLEFGSLIGILLNAIPAAFYMLVHIYADASLLRDIRAELETACEAGAIRASALKECALLASTWKEVMRVISRGVSARLVMEDTMLADRWLLVKDCVVMIPTAIMHADAKAWGEVEFNARRWMQGKAQRVQAASYRPFGGGSTICPGRHFGSMEIFLLVAVLVMGYDVEPVGERGWEIPRQKQKTLVDSVFGPERDVEVKMVRRKGVEKRMWSFEA